MLTRNHISFVLALFLLSITFSCKKNKVDENDYNIQKDYSSDILENYLKRSLTTDGIFHRPTEAQEHIRMVQDVGAKHLSRSLYIRSNENDLDDVLSDAEPLISQINAADPEIMCEAAIYNIISRDIERIEIPTDILKLFDQTEFPSYFSFNSMTHEEIDSLNLKSDEGLLDLSKVKARMWYVYLAQEYIKMGIEVINLMHFQNVIVDTTAMNLALDMTNKIRSIGDSLGRRGFVLMTAVTNRSIVRDRQNLLDFNSYYIRPKKGENAIEVVHQYNFHDAIYGNSRGAINPIGKTVETLPYVVFFSSGTSNGKITLNHGDDYVWGYDEISWFSILNRKDKIAFLESQADWVKRKDLVGFLQMPGIVPLFVNTPPYREQLFYCNKKSSRIDKSYNLEKAIRNIWFSKYQ